MNKRAATLDNFWIMIQFFGFVIFLLVIYVVWGAFSGTDDINTNVWEASSIGPSIKNNAQVAFDNWDWITVLVYFGTHIGVLVLAFLLKTHPVVYVAGILLIVILVMVSVPLSNAYQDTLTNDDFATAVTNIPKTDFIMKHFPTFEMIWGFITLIVFAGLAKSENLF